MGRIVALDYGSVRTGIAVTDEMQMIASGLTTVATDELIEFLESYIGQEKVDLLVIGEPKQKDNTPSHPEMLIREFVEKVNKIFPELPVERQDERFTSKIALQSMREGGLKKKQRRNKALIDEISATLILQAYLNRKV